MRRRDGLLPHDDRLVAAAAGAALRHLRPVPVDVLTARDTAPFHVNSIGPDGPGRLLVSSRHTSTIYEIRKSDGKVLWRLGGKHGDFTMGPGTHFAWQHDARRRPDGTITLFDNAASHPGEAKQSKVLQLRVDERTRTVTLVDRWTHSPPLLSTSQGDGQFLPDGHVFGGWGSNPYASEYDRAGDVLFDLRFGGGAHVDSYRAFRNVWSGRPDTRPAVAVRADGGETAVYASGNGATGVARWRILAGPDDAHLAPVATVARDGFETKASVTSSASTFAVEALAPDDTVLRARRRSPARDRRSRR